MAARPDRVRIVRVQRDTLLLQSPTIAGDTIVGYRQNGLDYDRTGVLMQDVVTIEVWRFDVGRTVGLVAGVAIGVVIFKFLEREIGPLSRCKVGEIFC